jgi:hypothetical protein
MAKKPSPGGRSRPAKKLLDGLERVQDRLTKSLGDQVQLDMRTPAEGKGRTPWAVVGKLKLPKGADYTTLRDAIAQLESQTARQLGPRRLARVRVTYRGVRGGRGKRKAERVKREWTIGEIAPLDVTLARSQSALQRAWESYGDDTDSPSLAMEVEIWLSDHMANDTGEF